MTRLKQIGYLPDTFISINPTTEKTLRSFSTLSGAEIEQRLQRSLAAFTDYRKTSFARRSQLLLNAATLLEQEASYFGRLITTEMGKLFSTAEREVVKSAELCRYYASHGCEFLADEVIRTEAVRSYIRHESIGSILGVTPFNYPFFLVYRFAAPALMAGNTCLLKPAPNVPQCALAIEDIFLRAGFPAGVFQNLFVAPDRMPMLLEDERVKAVTVTGGVTAGQRIGTLAAGKLKKVTLELGGSDPFIVLPSADLDAAVKTAVQSRLISNGQSCIAAKRFIVVDSIADEYQNSLIAQLRDLRVGDPMDHETDLGPLATSTILESVEQQVRRSQSAGAHVPIGGRRLERCGYFYEPTLVTEIPADAPLRYEEVFGPVASLFRAKNLDDAIRIANDSPFGLGASVWTRDENEYKRCIDELEAGMIFVNSRVISDPRVPFGGIKQSGYGRASGKQGIREYAETKTVWVE